MSSGQAWAAEQREKERNNSNSMRGQEIKNNILQIPNIELLFLLDKMYQQIETIKDESTGSYELFEVIGSLKTDIKKLGDFK